MTDFATAYERTNIREGGQVHHPLDRGGRTYRGIAERWHPTWRGWKLLDREAPSHVVDKAHKKFFYDTFWAPLGLDSLDDVHQALANEVYDTAVLTGRRRSARWLQRALNALNNRGRRWPDLTVDSIIGGETIAAINAASGHIDDVVTLINVQLGNHLLELTLGDQSQEVFMVGWLRKRVSL